MSTGQTRPDLPAAAPPPAGRCSVTRRGPTGLLTCQEPGVGNPWSRPPAWESDGSPALACSVPQLQAEQRRCLLVVSGGPEGPCTPAFGTVEGRQNRFSSFRKQAQQAPPTTQSLPAPQQGPELSRDWVRGLRPGIWPVFLWSFLQTGLHLRRPCLFLGSAATQVHPRPGRLTSR